jgi:hypothetical protein
VLCKMSGKVVVLQAKVLLVSLALATTIHEVSGTRDSAGGKAFGTLELHGLTSLKLTSVSCRAWL